MKSRILIDTNVPIYSAGQPHPLKEPCIRVLQLIADHPDAFFTDAEVVQELLHRYLALRMWSVGKGVVRRFVAIMRGSVESIHLADIEGAAEVADRYPNVSARDLIHASVMTRVSSTHVVSADRHFDSIAGIVRLDPADYATWAADLENI